MTWRTEYQCDRYSKKGGRDHIDTRDVSVTIRTRIVLPILPGGEIRHLYMESGKL